MCQFDREEVVDIRRDFKSIIMVDFHRVAEHLFRGACEDLCDDYQSSKVYLREIGRKVPLRHDGDYDPAVLLGQKRYCMDDSLQISFNVLERRKRALEKVEDIAQQKRDLLEQEKTFQKSFIEFNDQVVQNRQKRERAFLRMVENKLAAEQRQKDIDKILSDVLKMREYKHVLTQEIAKNLIYEEFLGSVLYDFEKHATPFDVIRRYVALYSKRKYLITRSEDLNAELKTLTQVAVHFMENYHEMVLDMRKMLSQSLVKYDHASKKTNRLEARISTIWDECNSKLEDLIVSVNGIRNLNEMMQKRQRQSNILFRLSQDEKVREVPAVIREVVDIRSTMRAVNNVSRKVAIRMKVIQKLWGKNKMFTKSPEL